MEMLQKEDYDRLLSELLAILADFAVELKHNCSANPYFLQCRLDAGKFFLLYILTLEFK